AHEKAVLVGVILPGMTKALMEEHLDELSLLAQTAGAEVVGRYIQRRDRINPTYFIGKGKAQQIVQQSQELDVQLIIFDDELSPSQIRNFLKISDSIKVIDRTGLILDIFQRHAQTRESKTQVELAHLQYLLPRLTRLWTHLERQMGGIGTRAGAGETQIEVDRRIIRDRIAKLRKDLKKIDKERETQSKRRKEMFRVALVGYTNAGKSTLLNALTGADVFVQDQLFATLDTTIRTLEVNDHHRLLLSDSVGFIRKLPHTLVASFRSTLMEVLEADLLLLMLDGSSYLLDEQLQTVREVLNEIGARDKEAMLVINKIDLIEDPEILQGLKARFPEAVFISALNHLRLDALQEAMVEEMEKSYRTAQVVFDPGLGKEIATVFQEVEVLDTSYEDDGVHLTIRGERVTVERLKALANRNGRKE
ncbi:MAG TPA: GTPase HflX, partial [Candidatus Marinimicrobia bacterium]|nr:GTPase HflX [Candidatus Neomarinimicrobiota bacterium]